MEINYLGAVYATRSVLPSMKSRKKGKITLVSSLGGLTGLYGYTTYAGSKFALRGFAEALQMEVKPFDISITLSFPADTETPCFEEENKTKPLETKLLSETAGILKPEKMARVIFEDTLVINYNSIMLILLYAATAFWPILFIWVFRQKTFSVLLGLMGMCSRWPALGCHQCRL